MKNDGNESLNVVQENLMKDHSKTWTAIGGIMILGGFAVIWTTNQFSFAIVAAVWGSIIICVNMFFLNRAKAKQIIAAQLFFDLEKTRIRMALKEKVILKTLEKDLPEGLSSADVQVFLTECIFSPGSELNVKDIERKLERH